jgi:hypothetical protein
VSYVINGAIVSSEAYWGGSVKRPHGVTAAPDAGWPPSFLPTVISPILPGGSSAQPRPSGFCASVPSVVQLGGQRGSGWYERAHSLPARPAPHLNWQEREFMSRE